MHFRNCLDLRANIKLALLAILLPVANTGFADRVHLLLFHGWYQILVPYLGIWAIAIAAIIVSALQPNGIWRTSWALLIAASTGIAWGYYDASHSDLTFF